MTSADDTPSARRSESDGPRQGGRLTAEQWSNIEALFGSALERPTSHRAAFLAEACPDPALRAEVQNLLSAHEQESWFIDGQPPWMGGDEADDASPIPDSIGPYRILRSLGRGGMGQVYLAERQAPGFARHVALKVMRRGLDTEDLVERFARERQILGRLDHPNIARLYDVGLLPRAISAARILL